MGTKTLAKAQLSGKEREAEAGQMFSFREGLLFQLSSRWVHEHADICGDVDDHITNHAGSGENDTMCCWRMAV